MPHGSSPHIPATLIKVSPVSFRVCLIVCSPMLSHVGQIWFRECVPNVLDSLAEPQIAGCVSGGVRVVFLYCIFPQSLQVRLCARLR
jgi:hypothetical protein